MKIRVHSCNTEYPEGNGYAAIILAVAHKEFMSIDLQKYKTLRFFRINLKKSRKAGIRHGANL